MKLIHRLLDPEPFPITVPRHFQGVWVAAMIILDSARMKAIEVLR